MNVSFDIEKLRTLMTHFYNLTKIRIVFFDNEFQKILSVPENDCDFCTAIRKNPTLNSRCAECDKKARSECAESESFRRYTCHSGLTEAISPIKINGIILGYIMLGQVIDKTEKRKKRTKLLDYVREFIPQISEAEYDGLTAKSKSQIEAAVAIMETCACYLWTNRLVSVNEDCLAALISDYIRSNLTSDLSVNALCDKFSVSRNKLYKISNDSYGMGIAAYIRDQRVQFAASLLRSGSTVAEAAMRSGFGDYNYFSAIFKKSTGILPKQYSKITSIE